MSRLFYGDIGHEPSLEPPKPPVIEVRGHCECCGEPIYEDDVYYDLFESMICKDCVDSSRRTA